MVPEEWVRESTRSQLTSEQAAALQTGYGYLWSFDSEYGVTVAAGSYGHAIIVDQARRFVVVLACRDSGPYETIAEYANPVIFETIIQPLQS